MLKRLALFAAAIILAASAFAQSWQGDLDLANIQLAAGDRHFQTAMSAKTDIGNRVSDMNKQGANIQYIQNPINSGIESYEDFEKHNKKFVPSWNLKHLNSPFQGESKKKK